MKSEERAPKFHTDATRDSLVISESLLYPIRSTTQIWIVTRHQYRTSALVPQTSFRGETSGGIAKYRLFSQAVTHRKEQHTQTKCLFSFIFRLPVLETLYALKEKMTSLLQQSTFLWSSRLSIVP